MSTPVPGSDDASFEAFATADAARLTGLSRVLAQNAFAADDLVQETLVRVLERWRSRGAPDDPYAYASTVMVNLHRSIWTRLRSREVLTDDFSYAPDGVPAGDRELALSLLGAVRTLPTRQRTTIALRYYLGLTEAETARLMGCAFGTVKSQAAKAIGRLRVSDVVMEDARDSHAR
jgi:RNA polymerase sigma-70 factor (sigma-E family)